MCVLPQASWWGELLSTKLPSSSEKLRDRQMDIQRQRQSYTWVPCYAPSQLLTPSLPEPCC